MTDVRLTDDELQDVLTAFNDKRFTNTWKMAAELVALRATVAQQDLVVGFIADALATDGLITDDALLKFPLVKMIADLKRHGNFVTGCRERLADERVEKLTAKVIALEAARDKALAHCRNLIEDAVYPRDRAVALVMLQLLRPVAPDGGKP